MPPIAQDMHRENITKMCREALNSANLKLRHVDAIATTVMPGLPLSLTIGTNFGKYLSKIGNKPFIPIHHMEAHALTARMLHKVGNVIHIVSRIYKYYIYVVQRIDKSLCASSGGLSVSGSFDVWRSLSIGHRKRRGNILFAR